MSKELCLHKRRRSYSTFKVRRGGGEEIPLFQGKEQRLTLLEQPRRDTPGPGKRNTGNTLGIARGHQRADTLKS